MSVSLDAQRLKGIDPRCPPRGKEARGEPHHDHRRRRRQEGDGIEEPLQVGTGPFGERAIYDVTGGTFSGERLNGRILPSGGDWALIDAEGVPRLDVRATLETDDGALLYVQYYGVLFINEKVQAALEEGARTDYGDTEFFTQPRFETGDERYEWLNRVVAVGEGRVLPQAVEYRVYALEND